METGRFALAQPAATIRILTISEHPSHQIRRLDLAFALAAGIAVACVLSSQPTVNWPFEDTANYLSVASSAINGDELQTDLIYYPEQASFRSLPAPQTVFPPGYSLAVAAVTQIGDLTVERSSQILCLTGYACSAPLLMCLAIFCGLRRTTAAIIVGVWLLTTSFWVYTCSITSEPLFIALTMTAIAGCSSSENRWRMRLVAGTATAGAFSIRYVGVFLAVTLGLAVLKQYRSEIRNLLRCVFLLLGPMAFLMVILFTRNHLLSGNWRGGNNYESQSFYDVLIIFYYSVCRLIGFFKNGRPAGRSRVNRTTDQHDSSDSCRAKSYFSRRLADMVKKP